MKCPVCARDMVFDTRDVAYFYKGESTHIFDVRGEYCPACSEYTLDAEESARVSADMLAFNKQINATIIDPKFITEVRKKLNLDQKEAAEIFGGGVNAFSRYETGKTRPPVALVKLLRVLDARPELLDSVR